MEVRIKKVTDTAKMNTTCELFADIEKKIIVNPKEKVEINTGVIIYIPKGYYGLIHGCCDLSQTRDVIGDNYKKVICIPFFNTSDEPKIIVPGQKIATVDILRLWTSRNQKG